MTGGPGPRGALSEGLETAGAWFGAAALGGSWVAASLTPGTTAAGAVLHASGILVAAGGGVLLVARPRPALRPVQVGAAAVLLLTGFAIVLEAVAPAAAPPVTAAFPLTAAKLALLGFAASAGRRRAPLVTGAVLVAGAEGLCAALGPPAGLVWTVDIPPLALLALVAASTLGLRSVTGRLAAFRRAAEEAAEQDVLVRTRAVARSRSAAVVHDGVLGDLAALAALPPGPLPDRAASAIRATLDLLAAPDWGAGEPTGPVLLPGGAVLAAVRGAERGGLTVRLDGELDQLRRLDPAVELALGRAVEQCLANTRLHAGTDRAEVTVLTGREGLSVMVADAGSGFEPGRVHADRMGLTTSITGRLSSIGGEARVFASPGIGTTVLLTVPRTEPA